MPLALRWRRQLAALPLGFSQASEDGATTRSTGAYDALTKTHTRSTRSGFRVLTTHPPLPFFVRARCTCAKGVVHEYTRGGFVRGRKISLRVDLWSLPPYIESQNHSTQQSARAGLLRMLCPWHYVGEGSSQHCPLDSHRPARTVRRRGAQELTTLSRKHTHALRVLVFGF